jgi:zinc-finger binding domain of transposase IS66/Transposase C of IS166 homeodomain
VARSPAATSTGVGGIKTRIADKIGWHRFGGVVQNRSVRIDLDNLPDDPATLQQMLRDVVQELNTENDKLRLLIHRLVRHQFGRRRSEQLTNDQLQLGLEDLEQTVAANQAAQDGIAPQPKQRKLQAAPAQRNLGDLPAHLPRYEVVVDIGHRECPCCGGALHVIGETRSEQLDVLPAQLRVRVTRRPRYACWCQPACKTGFFLIFGAGRIASGLVSYVTGRHQAAPRTRCRSRSRLARPNIVRLIILSRLICPSAGLVVQGRSSAALTAS